MHKKVHINEPEIISLNEISNLFDSKKHKGMLNKKEKHTNNCNSKTLPI